MSQHLPVLVKPVVGLGLDVEWVSEVGWTGRSHPESVFVFNCKSIHQLLVLSLVVVLHDSEVPHSASAYTDKRVVLTLD